MALDRALGTHVHPDQVTAMPPRFTDPVPLEARIGHTFADRDLLFQALTHVSANGRSGHYQRLEFLGDRVLGVVVAELLFKAFPKENEGELSRRLSELVRRETCADVAAAWEVGPYLILGPGESRSGGRLKTAILGDVCEAVIGAVFLDGGYPPARDVVTAAFGPKVTQGRRSERDPKTALQEWAQGRGHEPPSYMISDRSGPDHAPLFRVAVTIDGVGTGEGAGSSKRAAEQAAAEAMLQALGVRSKEGSDA
jgi:ribonuclease-3